MTHLSARLQATIDQSRALLRTLTDEVARHHRVGCDYLDACPGGTVCRWIDHHPYVAGGLLSLALVDLAKNDAARLTRQQVIDSVTGTLTARRSPAFLDPDAPAPAFAEDPAHRDDAIAIVEELLRIGALDVADDPLADLDDRPGGSA
jgi:hypothetical protein